MKDKKIIYFLMFLPLVVTIISMFLLPSQVVVRYNSDSIQYGSKYIYMIFPVFGIWMGAMMLLAQKIVRNTEQEALVKKITYIPLGVFNIVDISVLIAAFVMREGETNMEMIDVITGCFTGAIAIGLAVYVSFTARCRGPILSNSYLWLSKEEKEKADKKVEYKMVTIVFGGLSLIFTMLTIHIVTSWKWALTAMWVLIAFVVIYAFYDAIKTAVKK